MYILCKISKKNLGHAPGRPNWGQWHHIPMQTPLHQRSGACASVTRSGLIQPSIFRRLSTKKFGLLPLSVCFTCYTLSVALCARYWQTLDSLLSSCFIVDLLCCIYNICLLFRVIYQQGEMSYGSLKRRGKMTGGKMFVSRRQLHTACSSSVIVRRQLTATRLFALHSASQCYNSGHVNYCSS